MKTGDLMDLRDKLAARPADEAMVVKVGYVKELVEAVLEARDIAGDAIPRSDDVDKITAWQAV